MRVRCPKCSNPLLRKSLDGVIRLRSAVTLFKSDGACIAVCQKCKGEVELPISLDLAGLSAEPSRTPPRMLVVRKGRKRRA